MDKNKQLEEAALKLYNELKGIYGIGYPAKFIVGMGVDDIVVYAPKQYKEIPESVDGFRVRYEESDCKAKAL